MCVYKNKNRMAGNPCLVFLKSYRSRHKDESMKIAMKKAAVEYRASKGKAGKAAKPAKKSRKAKKKKSK